MSAGCRSPLVLLAILSVVSGASVPSECESVPGVDAELLQTGLSPIVQQNGTGGISSSGTATAAIEYLKFAGPCNDLCGNSVFSLGTTSSTLGIGSTCADHTAWCDARADCLGFAGAAYDTCDRVHLSGSLDAGCANGVGLTFAPGYGSSRTNGLCFVKQAALERVGGTIASGYDFNLFGFCQLGMNPAGDCVAFSQSSATIAGIQQKGKILVYKFQGGAWTQHGNDIIADENIPQTSDSIGRQVHVSADCSRLAAMTHLQRWVTYNLVGTTWTRINQVITGHNGGLGGMSSDGNRLIFGQIGGYGHEGKVTVFQYSDATNQWEQLGSSIEQDDDTSFAEENLGATRRRAWVGLGSNSISADGQIISVNAVANAGTVMTFQWSDQSNEWTKLGQALQPLGGVTTEGTDRCHYGLLSGDGKRLAQGCTYYKNPDLPDFQSGRIYDGIVYMWEFNGGQWSQMGAAIKGLRGGVHYGSEFALSHDGSVLVISSYISGGDVAAYKWTGSGWQLFYTSFGDSTANNIGANSCMKSPQLSADGTRLAYMCPQKSDDQLSVYKLDPGSTGGGSGSNPTAVGDPHLRNTRGEKFNIARPGEFVLLRLPLEGPLLLNVSTRVDRFGDRCGSLFMGRLGLEGSWLKEVGQLTFFAGGGVAMRDSGNLTIEEFVERSPSSMVHVERPVAALADPTKANKHTTHLLVTLLLGPAKLKVSFVADALPGGGVADSLWLTVSGLGGAKMSVGGLLGEDDHSSAAAPDASCIHPGVQQLFSVGTGPKVNTVLLGD